MAGLRDQLIYKALGALMEMAEDCGKKRWPPTLMLRFTLAYLFCEGGARPDRRWVYDSFWRVVTSPPEPERTHDAYMRQRDARMAITGMINDLGLPQTPAFHQGLSQMGGRSRAAEAKRLAIHEDETAKPDSGAH